MTKDTKTYFRFYTISDYEKEEIWLRQQAKQGWMLKKVRLYVYLFERCQPQDIVYKLEFRETPLHTDGEYIRMLEDYGWHYQTSCNNFRYFWKNADEDERHNELFTDDASKMEMLRKITLRRFVPLIVIFLCCVLPNSARLLFNPEESFGFRVFWYVMFCLYVFLFVWVSIGFFKLRKKYGNKK